MFFQISLFLILFLTFDWEKLKYGSWHFLLWSKGCYSWLADNKRREITIIIAPALSAYWRDSISHLVHSPSTAHRPHSSKEMVKIRPEVLEWEMFNFMGFYNWISERVRERERERDRERDIEREWLSMPDWNWIVPKVMRQFPLEISFYWLVKIITWKHSPHCPGPDLCFCQE